MRWSYFVKVFQMKNNKKIRIYNKWKQYSKKSSNILKYQQKLGKTLSNWEIL